MKVHAIVSAYGDEAYGLHSPQLPELFAGGVSESEYTGQALARVLAEAGAPSDYDLVEHRQVYTSRGDREWYTRLCMDRLPTHRAERVRTLEWFRDLLEATPRPVDEAAKEGTGEVLFIICRLDDRLGWLSEQLADEGCATIVAPVGDRGLWVQDISRGTPREGYETVAPDTTVRNLVELHAGVRDPSGRDFLTADAIPEVSRVREPVLV